MLVVNHPLTVALTAGAATACQPKNDPGNSGGPVAAPTGTRQRGVVDPLPRQRYLALRIVRFAPDADPPSSLAEPLPAFVSDRFEGDAIGGDLLLQVCADRKATTAATATTLLTGLGSAVRPGWAVDGYRGEVDGVAARDVLGFYDGIAGPDAARAGRRRLD